MFECRHLIGMARDALQRASEAISPDRPPWAYVLKQLTSAMAACVAARDEALSLRILDTPLFDGAEEGSHAQ